jgi:hypothetical protein
LAGQSRSGDLPGILRNAPEHLIEQLLAALDVGCLFRKSLEAARPSRAA